MCQSKILHFKLTVVNIFAEVQQVSYRTCYCKARAVCIQMNASVVFVHSCITCIIWIYRQPLFPIRQNTEEEDDVCWWELNWLVTMSTKIKITWNEFKIMGHLTSISLHLCLNLFKIEWSDLRLRSQITPPNHLYC